MGSRRHSRSASVCVFALTVIGTCLAGSARPVPEADAQAEVVLVGGLVAGTYAAVDHAADRLQELGADLESQVNRDLRDRIAQLEGILRDQVTKPINALTGEARRAVDELVAIRDAATAITERLQTCTDITVSQGVQQLGAILSNLAAENMPFSSSQPRVSALVPIDGRPLAVRPPENVTQSTRRLIALRGSFTRFDPSCGRPRLFASREGYPALGERGAVTRELTIKSADAQEVRAELPLDDFHYGGVFTFSYVFPSATRMSCEPASAHFAMLIPTESGPYVLVKLAAPGLGARSYMILLGGVPGETTSVTLDLTRRFGPVDGAAWSLSATAAWPTSGYVDLGPTAPAAQRRVVSDASGLRVEWTPDSTGGTATVVFPRPHCRQ